MSTCIINRQLIYNMNIKVNSSDNNNMNHSTNAKTNINNNHILRS